MMFSDKVLEEPDRKRTVLRKLNITLNTFLILLTILWLFFMDPGFFGFCHVRIRIEVKKSDPDPGKKGPGSDTLTSAVEPSSSRRNHRRRRGYRLPPCGDSS